MKISVHLEADSAEELQAFFAAFHVEQGESDEPGKVDRPMLKRIVEETQKLLDDTDDDTQPVDPAKLAKAREQLWKEADAPVEEQPVKKARKPRGPNKQKAAPEEPVVDIKPPVDHAPAIKVPAQPKTEAVSRQELLDVFSEYVQRYGVSFGYTDISTLLQKTLGDGIRKASDVPDESLGEAVGAIRAAINDNPYNRKRDYA